MITDDSEVGLFLAHHGILGMHWGQHKDRVAVKRASESMHVRLKNGTTLHLEGNKVPAFARYISKLSPKLTAGINNSSNFTLKDHLGNKVGEMTLFKESPTSLNVVWVGVNNKARGHGYATGAMNAAVSYAKSQKLKTVTLEVPGNAPDARHIYEKLGFKAVGQIDDASDPVWGGLTKMQLNLKK